MATTNPSTAADCPRMTFGRKAMIASVALLAGWTITTLIRVNRRIRAIRNMEQRHNRTLKESFSRQ